MSSMTPLHLLVLGSSTLLLLLGLLLLLVSLTSLARGLYRMARVEEVEWEEGAVMDRFKAVGGALVGLFLAVVPSRWVL